MKWLIGAGVAAVLLAGCGSGGASAEHQTAAKAAQSSAAQALGAAARSATTTTTTASALPDYTTTVQALVQAKVNARLRAALKSTPDAPPDARILSPSASCSQTGGENYACSVSYLIIGQAEGFAEQYQVTVDATCYEANDCVITSVGTPVAESGTQK